MIVDLDSSALNQGSVDAAAERELAKVNLALEAEVLKDTAPVLEGTKVKRSTGARRRQAVKHSTNLMLAPSRLAQASNYERGREGSG